MELNVVNKILEPYLKMHDLILYDVELVKEFGYLILRVSIDKTSRKEIMLFNFIKIPPYL